MVFESDNKPIKNSRRNNYQQIQEKDKNTDSATVAAMPTAAAATRPYCKLSIDEYLLQ